MGAEACGLELKLRLGLRKLRLGLKSALEMG